MPQARHLWQVKGFHCYDPSHGNDKVYLLAIERTGNSGYAVSGWYAARARAGIYPKQCKAQCTSLAAAQLKMSDCERERRKKGYIDIESSEYKVPAGRRVTLDGLMTHAETSLIVGYGESTVVDSGPAPIPTVSVKAVKPGESKALRDLTI